MNTTVNNLNRLKGIKQFVLDMDGTIYLGDRLFPYTHDFLSAVQSSGRAYCFFTNNSSKNRAAYIDKLTRMGITIRAEHMMISNDVIIKWLKENRSQSSVYVVGTPSLIAQFEDAGILLSDTAADLVVLGFDTTLTYEKLVKACDLIRSGAEVYGINEDLNCPVENGFIPDCGSIAALVRTSTGKDISFFGKPSRHTLDYIIERSGCRPEEIAVIGDRLYTDIALADQTPVLSILVLSGETGMADLDHSDIKPDLVFQDIGALIPYL